MEEVIKEVDMLFTYIKKLRKWALSPDSDHKLKYLYLIRRVIIVIMIADIVHEFDRMETAEVITVTSTICIESLAEIKSYKWIRAQKQFKDKMVTIQSHLSSKNGLRTEKIDQMLSNELRFFEIMARFFSIILMLVAPTGITASLSQFFFNYKKFYHTTGTSDNQTISFYDQSTTAFLKTPKFIGTSRKAFFFFCLCTDLPHISASANICALDLTFAILTIFATSHMTAIKIIFEDFFTNSKEMSNTLLKTKLNKAAIYLEDILDFCRMLEDHFNVTILFQTISSTISIGFILYLQTTMGMSDMTITYTFYFMGVLMQIYLYCFFGTKLTTAAEEIPYSLFHKNWMFLDKTFARTTSIITSRMMKSIHITIGKVKPLSRSTFLEIVKTGYSFVAFMKQRANPD